MISGTGLGNPDPVLLNNSGLPPPQAMVDEAIELYFPKYEGCDFTANKNLVALGIEPSYQYDPLCIVAISKDINESYLQTGYAFGGYGTQLVKKSRFYKEYKYNSKFKRFVDKWHPVLFKEKK